MALLVGLNIVADSVFREITYLPRGIVHIFLLSSVFENKSD